MTEEIECGENPTVTDSETDVCANLWEKGGHRRLYLNGFGLDSENRYVDLDTAELHGGYVSTFDVSVGDGTLIIEDNDGPVVVVDLDVETDGGAEDASPATDADTETRAVADGGVVADDGDETETDDERVEAFLESDRVRIDSDGVAYSPAVFNRWQKYGKDRFYVNNPGEGHVELNHETFDRHISGPMLHPDPALDISGSERGTNTVCPNGLTDDGHWVVWAHDGASSHWPVLVVPDAEDGQ